MNYEDAIFNQMIPTMEDVCKSFQLDCSTIRLEELKGYSSVYFGQFLIMRIRCRGQKNYIAISDKLSDIIPEGLETYRIKSDDMIRIPIQGCTLSNEVHILLSTILTETINRIPKAFDCCSRYESCSDVLNCVHPDRVYALQCGYRKILKSGRVFFGKNRNI